MHDQQNEVLTEAYKEDEYWDDLLRVTGGNTDEHLARMTIRASSGVFGWMQDAGVRFQPSLTGTLNLGRTNAFFLGGGKALVNAYYLTAERLGVEIIYDSEVVSLNMDDGSVRSIDITYRGFPETLRAKCVVASSGGFQANLDWMRQHWGDAVDNFIIRGTPYNRGRVLKNLLDQGVSAIGDPTQCHAVALDARAPKFDGGITTRLDSVPYSVVVNRNGDRFYDEGEDVWPKRYAIWGRLIAQQPDQIAYSICDSKAFPLFMPSVYPAIKADTLEELAVKMKLDPTKVRATIDLFNKAVKPGQVFDNLKLDGNATEGLTPNKTNWARSVDKPPFYGYPLRPGITFTYLGVRVNDKAQVLMENGQPSGNLFASGEIMSGNILGKGYLAGFGMAIGTVFGRIAGQEAARRARN
jgi:tricarballylate dehydrogenase